MSDPARLSPPLRYDGAGRTVLCAVGLALRPGVFDLALENGRIAAITPRPGEAAGWLCLPPLADLHVHANRAFTLETPPPRDFEHAIVLTEQLFGDFDEARYAAQAGRFFNQALAKGTTRLRSHADIDPASGLAALRGTLAAADALREALTVEVVAFASALMDPAEAAARAVLREAIAAGADLLGAVPALYRDPRRSIEALLELAQELDVAVDVHLDEHLDARRCHAGDLARATLARGWQGRVTLSHGCAIAALPEARRRAVIASLAEAQITVVMLPATNLYLQDRGQGTPRRRGLTCGLELARAGVALRLASDNVRDAFYPYGNGDLLDIAHLAATAGHIDDPALLLGGICDGRTDLAVGNAADLLLVKGAGFGEAIAERPAQRVIFRHGVMVPSPM